MHIKQFSGYKHRLTNDAIDCDTIHELAISAYIMLLASPQNVQQ